MATHSSILSWEIPWLEKPGGLQSMGPQSLTRLRDFFLPPGKLENAHLPALNASSLIPCSQSTQSTTREMESPHSDCVKTPEREHSTPSLGKSHELSSKPRFAASEEYDFGCGTHVTSLVLGSLNHSQVASPSSASFLSTDTESTSCTSSRALEYLGLYLILDCNPTRILCPWDFPGKNTGVDCLEPAILK